jgi:hypothetical protein
MAVGAPGEPTGAVVVLLGMVLGIPGIKYPWILYAGRSLPSLPTL